VLSIRVPMRLLVLGLGSDEELALLAFPL
jgi:hypothetical protein